MGDEKPLGWKDRYDILSPGVKEKMLTWIANRGGVAVWIDHNLSRLGGAIYTPASSQTADGSAFEPTKAPQWGYVFCETVTEISRFRFAESMREVKRFRVGLRRGGSGFMVKLTDASTHRVREACEKAGPDSSYRFDYDAQEAVIEVPVWEPDPVRA